MPPSALVIITSASSFHFFVCLFVCLLNNKQLCKDYSAYISVYCNRSCLWVCVCVCVSVSLCYHDNSKLRASIFTKVGL